MSRAQRHLVILRHYLLVLVISVMYVLLIATNEHKHLGHARACAMGVHAGLTVVYAVQPWQVLEQIAAQCIGTLAILVDTTVVYAYVVFPLYIVAYLLLSWRQVQARVYTPLTTAE
jgi:hypothetical protein